jgi:PKD repeat protein
MAMIRRGRALLGALAILAATVGLLAAPTAVGAATNLVGNPGFETGTSGWNTNGGGSGITLTQVAGGHSGNYSAMLTNTTTSAQTCLLNDSPNWVAKTSPGSYTASLWARADAAGATLTLRFREYNISSGANLGVTTNTIKLTTAWQQVSVTASVVSPGASTLDFNAYVTRAAPGTCFYADDVAIANVAPSSGPTAALAVTPSTGTPPLAVTADASASTAGSAAIASYSFNFGDGTTVGPQAGATATHTYTTAGTYTVTVTVTDTAGSSSTATKQVTVTAKPPTAALSVNPSTGTAPVQVTADAAASAPGKAPISTYSFDFGDGTTVGPQSGGTAAHTYTTPGPYTVKVTVTDTAGNSSSATAQVTVNATAGTPPAAALRVTPSSGVAPLPVTADASGSTPGAAPISTYSFDFGDGTTAGPQAGATATHTYTAAGTYTVTVTVTDTVGSRSTSTKQVTVSTPPTSALSVTPSSGTAPLAVTADASASKAGSAPISTYSFNFGDGSTVVGPQSGAAAAHTYSSAGTYTVTVTVTDTSGLSSTATATVSVGSAATGQVAVYVGYYDTHHANNLPKPNPWQGSPNVLFQGTPDSSSGGWDSGGVRVDNLSGASLPFVSITVDVGDKHFALWNTVSLAAGQTLIVAQTAFQNFDTSDTSPAGCYGCDPSLCTTEVVSTVPVVHVTVDGTTTNYLDTKQVLNTKGVDGAGCNPPVSAPVRNDESQTWQPLASGP